MEIDFIRDFVTRVLFSSRALRFTHRRSFEISILILVLCRELKPTAIQTIETNLKVQSLTHSSPFIIPDSFFYPD
jgi:hypothetical protein